MEYLGRANHDERTIEQLVHKIYATFGEAMELLHDPSNEEIVTELRSTLNEQRVTLLQTFERYSKLAGRHFNLDRQTQRGLALQLYMLNTDVVELLRPAPAESTSATTSEQGSKPYDPANYLYFRVHALVISSRSQEILTTFFNRISGWAVPLNTLPPSAQTVGSVPDFATYNSREDLVTEQHLQDAVIPSNPSAFVHDKLPTAFSFRLLKLTGERPYITCELRNFSLQDYKPYQALSYCWGSSTQGSTIRCNGRTLRISASLKKGLRRLHEYARTSGREWFWIDQICINQDDNAERTQQVRMMRVIYQRSLNTIIWLPMKNLIAKAARSVLWDAYLYISALKRERIRHQLHISNFHHVGKGNTTEQDFDVELPPATDKRWNALAEVLEFPWFERCWVIQEIAVSKMDPIILCGNQHILWSIFQEVVIWLNRAGMGYRTPRMELVNSIQEIIGRRVWGDNGVSDTVSQLHVLLRLTSSFRSTDPRDKNFALLGLSCETQDPDHWPEELVPDYNRSVQDVYTAATRYCIRQTSDLSVLSQHEYGSVGGSGIANVSFPSWVPRLNPASSTRRISAFSLSRTYSGYQSLTEKFNKACGHTTAVVDPMSSPYVLRLRGIRISAVTICLPTVVVNEPDFHAGVPERYMSYLEKIVPTLHAMCTNIMCKNMVATDSWDAFNRTFFVVTTAGLTAQHDDASLEPLIHFHKFFDAATQKMRCLDPTFSAKPGMHRTRLSFRDDPYRYQRSSENSDLNVRDAGHYIAALQRLMNRRLFITESGHLGLGPASMMSGDIVTVLFGGNVPYVLRPLENGQWHFVGECYLDGYMRGEALDNEGKDATSQEWFELI